MQANPDGSVRVGGTQVLLDTIVSAFKHGASAEQIADCFPSITLRDVYATITYYLSHRDDVESYLATRVREAATIRAEIERVQGPSNLRQRLLARMDQKRAS